MNEMLLGKLTVSGEQIVAVYQPRDGSANLKLTLLDLKTGALRDVYTWSVQIRLQVP